jgi:hypothetical protein
MLGFHIGEVRELPQLSPLAERLGITVDELMRIYIAYWIRSGDRSKYPTSEIQRVFSAMEKVLARRQDPLPRFWYIMNAKWSVDGETLIRGKRLLTAMIEHLPQQSEAVGWLISLFLKLLAVDQTILSLAPSLLVALSTLPEIKRKIPPRWLEASMADITWARLSKLSEYTRHNDNMVRQGALALCEVIADSILDQRFHYRYVSERPKLKSLRLDWQVGLSLIDDTELPKKIQGITLLTLSTFPITDAARRTELLTALAQAREVDEVKTWARLLHEIPISKARESIWRKLLESILAQPRAYSSVVLTAAMERYASLAGKADPNMLGDEAALGLPAVRR